MKGLLIKDLKLIASQKNFFIMAIIFAAVFTWTSDDVTFAATYIILLLSMLTLTTVSYDDINGGMLFLLSLPIDRKLYVREKYVLAVLNLICSVVVSLIVCIGFASLKGDAPDMKVLLPAVMGIMVGMGMMLAVTIPLEFKFGVEKGRIAMIATMAIMIIAGMGVYKLLTDVLHVDVKELADSILGKLPEIGASVDLLIVGMLLVALLLVLGISYVFSVKIMTKKEF